MLQKADIEQRLPVWCALSQLFLDAELQPQDYASIAAQVRGSSYSSEELYRILREEVAPAFGPNLALVAGEWAGWSEDTVRSAVLWSLEKRNTLLSMILRRLRTNRQVDREWAKLAPYLLK